MLLPDCQIRLMFRICQSETSMGRQLIHFNFETVCQLPGRQQKKGMQGISGIILLFQNVSSSYGEPVRSAGTIF